MVLRVDGHKSPPGTRDPLEHTLVVGHDVVRPRRCVDRSVPVPVGTPSAFGEPYVSNALPQPPVPDAAVARDRRPALRVGEVAVIRAPLALGDSVVLAENLT